MICRVWRGWTLEANADAYERIVLTQVIPGIEARAIAGFRLIDLLRRPLEDGRVEFTTLMWFDDLESIGEFVGEDRERSHVPAVAREVLLEYDLRVAHHLVVERRAQVAPGEGDACSR